MADKSSDICANDGCMVRFEGKTPQESVEKLIAHKIKCDPRTPEERRKARTRK